MARVGREILVGGELRWVHEDADSNGGILVAGALDQGHVAFMQKAHGRHKAQRFYHRLIGFPKFRYRLNDSHILEDLTGEDLYRLKVLSGELLYDLWLHAEALLVGGEGLFLHVADVVRDSALNYLR